MVCVGNICRSPLGARLLSDALRGADISVSSAGIGALVGHSADATTAEVAQARGISLDGHVARQFTSDLGKAHDLILVMEPGHKREISRNAPELSGRVMLFDQWSGGTGIPDPYRKPRSFHESVHTQIHDAALAWAARLVPAAPRGVSR